MNTFRQGIGRIIRCVVLLTALLLGWGICEPVKAASPLSIVHTFQNTSGLNADFTPTLSGNTLYGATQLGGTYGNGILYKVNTDGTGYAILYTFTGGTDGADPSSSLTLIGNALYGTTASYSNGFPGTIFKINTDGTGFTTLHAFRYTDGAFPVGGLTVSGSTLYGVTSGGANGGTIFKINADGTAFADLYNFVGGAAGSNPTGFLVVSGQSIYGTTSGDGLQSYGSIYKIGVNGQGFISLHTYTQSAAIGLQAGLVLSGTTLYGATEYGGSNDNGTLYKLQTDGSGFTVLASIGTSGSGSGVNGPLSLSGGTIYGTTGSGGGEGIVFKVNTDGTNYSALYGFSNDGIDGSKSGVVVIGSTLYGAVHDTIYKLNTDGTNYASVYQLGDQNGEHPLAGLIQSGNVFYGTTSKGGVNGEGTVYKVNSDGTGFTTLHAFDGTDGADPESSLTLVGNTLYGTTRYDTIFKVNTDGTGYATLYTASGIGAPQYMATGLTLSGSVLYGGSIGGGSGLNGTIFKINLDGTGFSILYNFPGGNEGDGPSGPLIVSGNSIYGVSPSGGANNSGTCFTVHTDGTGFTVLHTFNASQIVNPPDGQNPTGGLVSIGSQLYGVTQSGGDVDGERAEGTLFTIHTDGTDFQTLYTFNGATVGYPAGGLLLNGNVFYGTTQGGAIFQIQTDGTNLRDLYDFQAQTYDGQLVQDTPNSGLVLNGNTLYGTADSYVESDPSNSVAGHVFALSLNQVPSLSAVDVAADIAGGSRVLYMGNDGSMTTATFSASGQFGATGATYGPYVDFQGPWQAQSLTIAPDGSSRVLWTRADGAAGLWTLDQSGYVRQIGPVYGPYPGWSARLLGVAGDGTSRVLWTNVTKAAGVWSFDGNDAATTIGPTCGPYSDSGGAWTAESFATASDGTSRVLWSRSDGAAGVWTLNSQNRQVIVGSVYGPVVDSAGIWSAVGIGIAGDETSRLLWRRADGAAGLWTMTASDQFAFTGPVYGPFVVAQGVWSMAAFSAAGDGTSRVLWTRTDEAFGVWTFDANDVESVIGSVYGPY